MQEEDDVSGEQTSDYLEEACYYLRKRGLTFQQVSQAMEVSEEEAARLFRKYEGKIVRGKAQENDVDKALWEDIYNDSIGNEKVTFVRDDGFYHCRRSDLEQMDSKALMAIFETSRKFLDFDIYKPYIDSKAPTGYDPMALQRQVKHAMELIETILRRRWDKEKN